MAIQLVFQVAFGQNQTKETDFVTYQNPILGYTLQHPSNWEPDKDVEPDGMVRCSVADLHVPIFVVSIQNLTEYLDTDTLTLKIELCCKRFN